MICEEYFVTALNELIEVKGISPDVAGATFMAAGSSSPEVFAALIGLFFSAEEGGGAGVGTVVGSAVFNVLVIIGGAALYSDRGITMEWRTLLRDAGFYAISLVALYYCFYDGILTAAESAGMVGTYFAYLLACAFFPGITGRCCPEKKKAEGYVNLEHGEKQAWRHLLVEQKVKDLMERMERDRFVLFKNARRSVVAPYFGVHTADIGDVTQASTSDAYHHASGNPAAQRSRPAKRHAPLWRRRSARS
jgi:hypothetical protein